MEGLSFYHLNDLFILMYEIQLVHAIAFYLILMFIQYHLNLHSVHHLDNVESSCYPWLTCPVLAQPVVSGVDNI